MISIMFTDIFWGINCSKSHRVYPHENNFTFIFQVEGASIFAPVVLQEDIINSNIALGDLEF